MPSSGDALDRYCALLREWAPRVDLVSPRDLDRFETRHVEDSLRALPLLDRAPPGPCIDVGSGAGLPGIPLALRSTRAWRLLEPRAKRAAFLEEVVRELGLDAEVIVRTAEEASTDPALAACHALAISRAVAAPRTALALSEPLVVDGGLCCAFVGSGAETPPEAEETVPGIATLRVTRGK